MTKDVATPVRVDLVVKDDRGKTFSLVVVQRGPAWPLRADPPRRGYAPCDLLTAVPLSPGHKPTTNHMAFPSQAVRPSDVLGTCVDLLLASGSPVPAMVTAYHGILRLEFDTGPLLVRDVLEIQISDPPKTAYTELFIPGEELEYPTAHAGLAGKLVVRSKLDQKGALKPFAVGLVIGGEGKTLIVVPVFDRIDQEGWTIVPLAHASTSTEANAAQAEVGEAMKINAVQGQLHQSLRDDFLKKFITEGFLEPDASFADELETVGASR